MQAAEVAAVHLGDHRALVALGLQQGPEPRQVKLPCPGEQAGLPGPAVGQVHVDQPAAHGPGHLLHGVAHHPALLDVQHKGAVLPQVLAHPTEERRVRGPQVPHVFLSGPGPFLPPQAVQLPKALPVPLVGQGPVAQGLAVNYHVLGPQAGGRCQVPAVEPEGLPGSPGVVPEQQVGLHGGGEGVHRGKAGPVSVSQGPEPGKEGGTHLLPAV